MFAFGAWDLPLAMLVSTLSFLSALASARSAFVLEFRVWRGGKSGGWGGSVATCPHPATGRKKFFFFNLHLCG